MYLYFVYDDIINNQRLLASTYFSTSRILRFTIIECSNRMNCLILYIHYIITKNKKISIIRKQFNGVISDSISYVIDIY